MRYHPAHLPPGLRVRDWRILERLQVGGFGAVYLVEYEGQRYALKISLHRPDSTPGRDPACTDERTRRELACLLALEHPNVARLVAHGRWPDAGHGYLFFVMEYVEGDTLGEWAVRHNPTLRQVLGVFIGLADTLAAAEGQSILHRDIKPSNILVRRKDSSPVLVDWGAGDFPVAKDITEEALAPGTPHYRSPESLRYVRQHRDDPEARYTYQPTDDLYALGVSFYEVLTGQKPFATPASDRQRLNAEIELRIPTPPHELNASVPPALSELVSRLLAKDPRDRPASGESLRRELESLDPESKTWDALLGLPRPVPGSRPPSEPPPARPARVSRGGWLGMAVVAVVALAYAGAGLLRSAHERVPPPITAPVPPAVTAPLLQPVPDAGSPRSTSPSEKGPPVKPADPQKRRPLSREVLQTGCLAVAGAIATLDGGCATVPLKPSQDVCPPAVVKAMKAQGIPRVPGPDLDNVLLNINWTEDSNFQAGPAVARLEEAYESNGKSIFPKGTLLYGHIYIYESELTSPGRPLAMRAHYTEARLPSGDKVPVCLSTLPTQDCVPRGDGFECGPTLRDITPVAEWDDEGVRPWFPRRK